MWRPLRLAIPKFKLSVKVHNKQYSSSAQTAAKAIFSIIASAGLGFAGAAAYSRYEQELKSLLDIPYFKNIYEKFPGDNLGIRAPSEKQTNVIEPMSSGLLEKEEMNSKKTSMNEILKPDVDESKPSVKDDTHVDETNVIKTEKEVEVVYNTESPLMKENSELLDNTLKETIEKLKKTHEDAVNIHKIATSVVKCYAKKLYEAVNVTESNNNDLTWKELYYTSAEKESAVNLAKKKAIETKELIKKLESDSKRCLEYDLNNQLAKSGKDYASKYLQELETAESEVAAAEKEVKTASYFEQFVKASKQQFGKELQLNLPNYVPEDSNKIATLEDLNLLIAHSYRRIEQLQEQIANQEITQKMKIDEAIRNQKLQDEQLAEFTIREEIEKRLDLEKEMQGHVASLKANFEVELHKQLLRQIAAHADHLKEVLKTQEQQLERKYALELEEKLSNQSEIFASEVSDNKFRLKRIVKYLKAKRELDKSSKNAQALWLACQALYDKIISNRSDVILCSVAKDIEALKMVAGEDNEFINTVLSSIPTEAINQGVLPPKILKRRFEKVKSVCKKVGLIDENNDSLYRYILSYVQSILMIDTVSIPKGELTGEVAVDSSELNTFDILNGISYFLSIDDLEQALCYANELKGEPKNVAKSWIKDVKLLLETKLAIKALLAYASSVSVQAYH